MGELVKCVASDGVRLAVEVDGNGPPLYALHGGPNNDRGDFGAYLSPVASYRRVHLLDARGCGDSQDGPPESYTIQRLAEDVEDTRQQLGHEQIELLAHSFGGVVAVTYALRWPQRLRALVLVDAAFRGWRSVAANPRSWPLWARVIAMNWQKDADGAAFHAKYEIANPAKRDEALRALH
ncbi:MAG: alpha/beta fold hydrolase, partial [bacterium]